jgi:hypothetical protein
MHMDMLPTKKTRGFAPGNPGKPKGAVTKVTAEIKDMIRTALDEAGGVEYLVERAKDPRTASAFLGLVGKVLPMTVAGAGPNGEHVFQKIVVEVVKPE